MRKRDLLLPQRFRKKPAIPELNEEIAVQLVKAIIGQDVPEIKRVLKAGADPDIGIDEWRGFVIPLTMAVDTHNEEIVGLLLEAGANPGRSASLANSMILPGPKRLVHPLRFFGAESPPEHVCLCIARQLFSYNISLHEGWEWHLLQDSPILEVALARRHLDYAQLLVDNGFKLAEINSKLFPWAGVSIPNMLVLVHFLNKNGFLAANLFTVPLLQIAVLGEDTRLIRDLLAQGYSATERKEGTTALHMAAACGNDEILATFLDYGVDVDAKDSFGITPLLEAAFHGDEAVTERLISTGANIDATRGTGSISLQRQYSRTLAIIEPQWSCLHVAAHYGFANIVSLLLMSGTNSSLKGSDGKTALDLAIERRQYRTAMCLFKAFAPFTLTSPAVSSFFIHAYGERNNDLIAMLIYSGVHPTWAIPENDTTGLNAEKKQEVSKLTSIVGLLDKAMAKLEEFTERNREELSRKPKLCGICSAFFHRSHTYATSTFEMEFEFHDSCRLCALLQDSYLPKTPEERLHIKFAEKNDTEGKYQVLERTVESSNLAKNKSDHYVGHVIHQLPAHWDHVLSTAEKLEDNGTGSDAATAVAIHWIRTCVGSHVQCNGGLHSKFFPTRIIDLGSGAGSAEPKILENAKLAKPYIALSHRWGQYGLPFTTLSNISDRKRLLPMSTLSKTMQETFTIVKKLGFRYIWIDAICIIQDSRDDWLRESANMSDVFSTATLTLAVGDSDDHSTGLLRPRQGRCVRPVRFEEFHMPRKTRNWFEGEGTLYIMPSSPKVSRGSRPRGPLDSRGWILQEQLLSPRILYYGNGELFWDCITLSASESSPVSASLLIDEKPAETWALKLIRRAVTGMGATDINPRHIEEAWLELVVNYTSRNLSYPTDKLIAMEGIFSSIQNIFNDAFTAGLWKDGLWRQLTWWVEKAQVDSRNGTSRFLAPSWSWLNAQGAIYYHNSIVRGTGSSDFRELTPLVEIVDIRAETIKRDSEIQGQLTILGSSFTYPLTQYDLKDPVWKSFHKKKLNRGRWYLDEALEMPVNLECLIIAEDDNLKMLVCLCIVPSPERDGAYRRVGLCHWDGLMHDVERSTGEALTKGKVTII